MDPLWIAIPGFLALTLVELVVISRPETRNAYFKDFLSSLGCGALDQLMILCTGGFFLGIYVAVHRLALFELDPNAPATWVLCVLAHDLAYYTFHRVSHRVNLLWAAHSVHHQSETFTFSVSLRQGTIATWFSYLFYLPLASVGFPLHVFIVIHAVYQISQFFVHTRLFPASDAEWILATPLLHRVHHGKESECVNRNYGGVFIVWDKVFGTFAPYTVEPSYGVIHGVQTMNPVWANLHGYAALIQRAKQAPSVFRAVELVLRHPEWTGPWENRATRRGGSGDVLLTGS